MKRMKFLLISALAVLVLLCGILFFLMRPQTETPLSSQSMQPSAQADIFPERMRPKSIIVENPFGGFTIHIPEIGNPYVEGLDPQWTDSAKVAAVLNLLQNGLLTFVKQTEDATEFGLSSPETTVTIAYETQTLTLEVGGAIAGQPALYVKRPDSDTIYSWRNAPICTEPQETFLTLSLTPPASAVSQGPKSVTFGGTSRETPLVLSQGSDSQLWVISSHSDKRTKQNIVDETIMGLFGITAEKAVGYCPTEAELTEYGLESPYATAEFSYCDASKDAQTVKLAVSAPQDDYVFVMLDGCPVVYTLPAEALGFLDLQYEDVLSNLPALFPITSIQRIEISGENVKETYDITHENDTITVKDQQGSPLNDSAFRKFYQCLVGIPGEQFTKDAPPADASQLLCITFYFTHGQDPVTVALYDCPPLQAYITVDGETEFLTKAVYAQTIVENLARLASGEEILPLY